MLAMRTGVCIVGNAGMVAAVCMGLRALTCTRVMDCGILVGAIGLLVVWASMMGVLCMDDWN